MKLESKQRRRSFVDDDAPTAEGADREISDCRAEIDRLRAEVDRLTEENRAFVCSVRHMTNAAEEVLSEARREAADTRARAAAEAYERLVVARADARAAVHEERQRTAAELELLAAVRERIEEERSTLSSFQDDLSGRLRGLVTAVFDFEDRPPTLSAGPRAGQEAGATAAPASTAAASPDAVASENDASGRPTTTVDEVADDDGDDAKEAQYATFTEGPAKPSPERYVDTVVVEEADSALLTVDPGDEAEAELEAAFAAFFHADVEGEPSRHWILDGR